MGRRYMASVILSGAKNPREAVIRVGRFAEILRLRLRMTKWGRLWMTKWGRLWMAKWGRLGMTGTELVRNG